MQYTVPTQLSGDDLSGDARDAVGALIQKIAIRPPALVRQRSHVSLHTLDPDGLSTAVGMNYDRVRMAILSVMVSLFRSYRMYIKIGPGRQLPITLRTRSHSDDIVSTGVGIPLSSAVVTSSSAQSGVEGAAGVPLARKPPTPRFKDLFSIEEFLAEQTHDESRALLRYCVTVFMPFFMFVTERCEWQGEADLFDRYGSDVLVLVNSLSSLHAFSTTSGCASTV